jgi:predicted ATPase/transcriptional regulator with XRE-family HTH domain
MEEEVSFCRWLRQRRKACDLTQAELARRVGCAEGTIRKLEANELRPSRQLAARLATPLGIGTDQRAEFVEFARAGSGRPSRFALPTNPLPLASLPAPVFPDPDRHNLPLQPTGLIGRAADIDAVSALIRQPNTRLVTLTGPGGIGKTRLALQVAANLLNMFVDGVFLVPLAPLRDPALVVTAIAQTLGLRETGEQTVLAVLKAFLRRKQLLLLLDNCEHLLEAAALFADLLAACPQIAILATSRTPLHLRGEQEFAVPPLALPPLSGTATDDQNIAPGRAGRHDVVTIAASSALSVADLSQYPAVRLFVERARNVRPSFALTPWNGSSVAAICRRLDGLPLAIELAAAWVKLFEPAALLARLADPLALLTLGARDQPDRQRTLRATIDWSYHLLSQSEQALFARLSVFVGGCTIAAAEAVCADFEPAKEKDSQDHDLPAFSGFNAEPSLLHLLLSLVDKNLLYSVAGPDGEPRFSMLETISGYARERLDAREAMAALQRRHASYYLRLAEADKAVLRGLAQRQQWERLEIEYDNLRAALGWSLGGGDAEIGARLAAALGNFWNRRGYLSEGREWLASALSQHNITTEIRAEALVGAAVLASTQGDYPAAGALLEASMMLFRELERQNGMAEVLNMQGDVALCQGDEQRAMAFFEESLALSRQIGYDRNAASTLWNLGQLARTQRDYARASKLYDEALALFQRLEDTRGVGFTLWALGNLARSQKDDTRAAAYYDAALALARNAGDKSGIASALHKQSYLALHRGDHTRAEALLLESLVLSRDIQLKDQIAWDLAGLGGVAAARGQAKRAVRLLAAAEAWFDAIGLVADPTEREEHEYNVAVAQAQLGEQAFKVAWAEGRTLTLALALAEALA